jgi:serine/threonine-protein kinase
MSSDPSLIGRKLADRFSITGFLGEGGMATVYRGVQETGEPRDVAIKILHADFARDPTFVKRFRREAKSAARLQHPSTVRIIEFGVDDQLIYIVMELLVGIDLNTILARERRLPEARAANIVAQVCDALSFAHGEGIVHRDLKPENIMVLTPGATGPGQPDRLKVLDFGIAKIMDPEPTEMGEGEPPSSTRSVLTRAGTLIGTPEYMSPEQCAAAPIDARSDVYSCGVLLYHLVTGRVPFEGELPFEIVRKHLGDVPPPPSVFAHGIHPMLEHTILKALSKSPLERHQSAKELQEELLFTIPDLFTARHISWRPGSAPTMPSPARVGITPGAVLAPTLAMEPHEWGPQTVPATQDAGAGGKRDAGAGGKRDAGAGGKRDAGAGGQRGVPISDRGPSPLRSDIPDSARLLARMNELQIGRGARGGDPREEPYEDDIVVDSSRTVIRQSPEVRMPVRWTEPPEAKLGGMRAPGVHALGRSGTLALWSEPPPEAAAERRAARAAMGADATAAPDADSGSAGPTAAGMAEAPRSGIDAMDTPRVGQAVDMPSRINAMAASTTAGATGVSADARAIDASAVTTGASANATGASANATGASTAGDETPEAGAGDGPAFSSRPPPAPAAPVEALSDKPAEKPDLPAPELRSRSMRPAEPATALTKPERSGGSLTVLIYVAMVLIVLAAAAFVALRS